MMRTALPLTQLYGFLTRSRFCVINILYINIKYIFTVLYIVRIDYVIYTGYVSE